MRRRARTFFAAFGAAFASAWCAGAAENEGWEAAYAERLTWWSLRPVALVDPPAVANPSWARNDVDRFILSRLDADGLTPAPEADRRTLARRLSFALIGLPPNPGEVERFIADESPDAYDRYVQSLLP